MKMLAICKMSEGMPELKQEKPVVFGLRPEPVRGYVLAGQITLTSGDWGVYLFSSKEQDFASLRTNEGLYEIVTIMGVERTYLDRSLDTPLPANIRNRLNAWIAENTTWEAIPAGRTARQVVVEIFKRFNPYFDLSKLEIVNYG